jgi:hypothetical protein
LNGIFLNLSIKDFDFENGKEKNKKEENKKEEIKKEENKKLNEVKNKKEEIKEEEIKIKKEDEIIKELKKGIKQPVPIRKNSLNNWDPSKG